MLYRSLMIFLFVLVGCESPLLNMQGPKSQGDIVARQEQKPGRDLILNELNIVAEFKWLQVPSITSKSVFSLRFFDASDSEQLIDPRELQVEVTPWMNAHGHGTAPVEMRIDGMILIVDEIWFSMAGVWDINIKVKRSNQVASVKKIIEL